LSDLDPTISPEKWERIRDIYARVLDTPEPERARLAHQLCQGDPQIESVMDEMLSAHGKAGSFLLQPAAEALDYVSREPSGHELSAGIVLASRFHILGHLNSGGMGSVYEAWDSELQEIRALKTIRPEIASDLSVIERFKREVKQAQHITHPNICRVFDLSYHDFEPGDRIWFLTMQLLKGTTLLEHIREHGPFSAKQAMPLVEQMVSGLSAAHQHGIVHRDFKSSNVMLVPEGEGSFNAVITDFGLASPTAADDRDAGNFAHQGTPAYAAPEQWVHGVVAPAGDQYSLGVVMCEMLTGERPDPAALNQGPPKPARLPEHKKLDGRWEAAIRRCLEINPAARFRSIADILAAIDPVRRRKTLLNWVAAAAALILLSITGFLVSKSLNQPYSLTDLRLLTPAMDYSEDPDLSIDGKMITYVSDRAESGNRDIWVQRLPDGIPKRVTTDPATDEDPSISPDGHLVAFESSRSRPGIYLADVDHGGEKLIAAGGHGAKFSPDGHSLLYSTGDEYRVGPNGRLFLFDVDTGKSVQLASGMADARVSVWNSDGRHILFAGCANLNRPYPACKDWWITTPDGATPHPTGALPMLLAQRIKPIVYFGGWHGNSLIFSAERDGSFGLWELKIDPVKGTVSGPPQEPISTDNRNYIISSSLAENLLAICQLNPAVHVWRIEHAANPKRATATKVTGMAAGWSSFAGTQIRERFIFKISRPGQVEFFPSAILRKHGQSSTTQGPPSPTRHRKAMFPPSGSEVPMGTSESSVAIAEIRLDGSASRKRCFMETPRCQR